MKPAKSSLTSLLQPYSMESHLEFSLRFAHNKAMASFYPDPKARARMRERVWQERWVAATATVTRLDGTKFFID